MIENARYGNAVSIHVPLAEHDGGVDVLVDLIPVSIHVPLAEHDLSEHLTSPYTKVSIHVPLAEHDLPLLLSGHHALVSIHVPLAEHDFFLVAMIGSYIGFNSRAPRGARLVKLNVIFRHALVSIHVPLAEHDCCSRPRSQRPCRFNSRAPRGARPGSKHQGLIRWRFNSRAPRGARPEFLLSLTGAVLFQFTCPSRSTTGVPPEPHWCSLVSIHVPLAEHDVFTK